MIFWRAVPGDVHGDASSIRAPSSMAVCFLQVSLPLGWPRATLRRIASNLASVSFYLVLTTKTRSHEVIFLLCLCALVVVFYSSPRLCR